MADSGAERAAACLELRVKLAKAHDNSRAMDAHIVLQLSGCLPSGGGEATTKTPSQWLAGWLAGIARNCVPAFLRQIRIQDCPRESGRSAGSVSVSASVCLAFG